MVFCLRWLHVTRTVLHLPSRLPGVSGTAINPHLFRDCAATALTAEKPEYVLAAARILNHNQLSTTLKHYEHASMIQATARLHEVIGEVIHEAGEDRDVFKAPFDQWGEE